MHPVKTLINFLAILLFSSRAFSNDFAYLHISYYDTDSTHALGCGCADSTRVPFADGTNICIMWDANHATVPGPDSADVQPSQGLGYGQTNFTCTSFNGTQLNLPAGFFCFDPLLVIAQPVHTDSSWYYIRICGTDCQWYSTSFHVINGFFDVFLTPADWICSDNRCSSSTGAERPVIEVTDEERPMIELDELMLSENAGQWNSPVGLTISFDSDQNNLVLSWPSFCAQAYQAYRVYSASSVDGTFNTIVATTTNTSLILALPADAKRFYTVVPYTEWNRMGIDHNRAMTYFDSRLLQAGWDSTWTVAKTEDSLRQMTLDFVRDSACYDYKAASEFVSQFTFINPTYEATLVIIDSLYTLGRVSDREVIYLTRLVSLAPSDSDWSDTTMTDSLIAFEQDLLAVDWNENEALCLQVSSIALYSWELREYGWQIANGDSFAGMDAIREPTIGDIWDSDVVGGLIGALAGPEGAFTGAVLSSAFMGSRKLFMHLFM